jgi:hypothetical protein
MPNIYFYLATVSIIGSCGFVYYGYTKIFGPKNYKVIKDYKYKDSRIQLIVNPQHNLCGHCFNDLNQNDEIARFPNCDHHFCSDCVHELVDMSISNLKVCPMCM